MKFKAIAPENRLGLSREEAAEYVGVSSSTFDLLVRDGRMPRAKCINTRRLWERAAVEKAFARLPEEGQNDHEEGEWKDLKV